MLEEAERLGAVKFSALEFRGLVVLKFGDNGGPDGFFHYHTALGLFQLFGLADIAEGDHQPAVQGPVFINGAGLIFSQKRAGLVDDQVVPIDLLKVTVGV